MAAGRGYYTADALTDHWAAGSTWVADARFAMAAPGLCANAKDRIIPILERLKREQANPHRYLVHGLTDAINMIEELCYRLEGRSAK